MQGPRDAAATLAPFVGLAASVTCVPVPDEPASRDPDELAAAARALGLETRVAGSVPQALDTLAPTAAGARVLIFGSLYLAGAVLRLQEAGGA
jgi:dihydrofolate synthase/folylpolyglutamate synthase